MSQSNSTEPSASSTPSASTRSRLILVNQTPPAPSTTATPTTVATPKQPSSSSPIPVVDEKLFTRYSTSLAAESNRRKTEIVDHLKRLSELRKEAETLDQTDWMYESVEKLLGK